MLRGIRAYDYTLDPLKDNHYITEEENCGELSMRKLSMVWQYLDDIAIQRFFELCFANRPFIIDNTYIKKRFTDSGPVHFDGEIQLNLSDDYDRATFIEWFALWFFSLPARGDSPLSKIKQWFHTSMRKDAFGNFIPGIASWLDGDHLPLYSNDEQILFNEKTRLQQLYQTALYDFENNPRYINASLDFRECCDQPVVPGYSFEDVVFLYCLIAEKLGFSFKNVSFIFGGFLGDDYLEFCSKKTSVPYLFFLYESKLDLIFDFERDLDKRDLLYRFADKKKGKAFTYSPYFEHNQVTISLFQKESVNTVYRGNTILLPYHIHCTIPSSIVK